MKSTMPHLSWHSLQLLVKLSSLGWKALAWVTALIIAGEITQAQIVNQWPVPVGVPPPLVGVDAGQITTLTVQPGMIIFDLSNVSGNSTPLTQTVQGLTATFSSPGDPGGFSIFNPGDLTIGPNILADPGPAFAAGISLNITFSQPVSSVTMQFATDGAGPFNLSGFSAGNLVGSASAIGTIPSGHLFPEGVISFTDTSGFDSIALTSPGTPYFAIANVSVLPACTATGVTVESNENCDPAINSSCTANIVLADGSESTDLTTVVTPAQSVQVHLSASFGTPNDPVTDSTGTGVSSYVSGIKTFGDTTTTVATIGAQVCGSDFPNLARVFNYNGFDFHSSQVSDAEFVNSASMTQAQIQKFFEDQSSFLANFYLVGQIGGFLDENGNGKLDQGEPTYSATGKAIPIHAAGTRASAILSSAAIQQGVNPEILLVTLEKENSLVSRTKLPDASVLNFAMGCGTASNFSSQINCAARTFVNRFNDTRVFGRQITYPFFFHASDGIRHAVTGLGRQAVGFQIDGAPIYAQYRYTPFVQSLANGGGVYLFETLWDDFGF